MAVCLAGIWDHWLDSRVKNVKIPSLSVNIQLNESVICEKQVHMTRARENCVIIYHHANKKADYIVNSLRILVGAHSL